MTELIMRASNLLEQMYDPSNGLFSYSTRIVDGKYQNDFDHPRAQRYSINSLAGIHRMTLAHPGSWDFGKVLERYLEKHLESVTDAGDKGLLLYVLAECRHPHATRQFDIVKKLAVDEKVYCSQVLQDACWLLYGLIAYSRNFSDAESRALAKQCYNWLTSRFMNGTSLFPYHKVTGPRKRFVSFGGITYFLKAIYEYASTFDDLSASQLFKDAVGEILLRQGPMGEWAWFYDSMSGRVVDWYEVYSVHQEAMAMLFLLPAHDMGVSEVESAIDSSVSWLFGRNELGAKIMVDAPFFSYRSIRRSGPMQRQIRIARAALLAASGKKAGHAEPSKLEINKECRSYEMGWTLYAWAGRNDFEEFTGLRALERTPK
jgi:hypothetical protein